MPNKEYEIKLVNWTNFREQLEVSLNPFQDVIDYYNKIPKSLKIVEALPRNAMGKVTKPALKALI